MTTKSCLRRFGATAVSLLTVLFMLGLAGCDGRSGSSGRLPSAEGETALNEAAATTVTTKLSLALKSSAKTAMPKMASMAYEAAASSVQSATVSLTLPDGRTIAMSYVGNGEYKCSVTGLPSGSAGFIEAQIGGMVVKNFFDSIETKNGSLDAGLTNPDSTLVTDMLLAFAGYMDPSDPDYTIQDLLSNIGSAKLNIDVTSLKDQVADGQITGYELARHTYNNVLTWENAGLSAGAIDNLLFGDPNVSDLLTSIQAGGYLPPTTGSDEEEIRVLAAGFLDAYMNRRTIQDISPFYSDTNFLWHGNDKQEQMLEDAADWAVSPMFKNLTGVSLANIKYSVAKDSDFTGTGLTMYKLTIGGTMDLTYAGNILITRQFGRSGAGLFVAKVNGKWVLFGDRKRMWFDYSVGYFSSAASSAYTQISFDMGNGATYVPTSVEASCPDLFGEADPVTLLAGGGIGDPDEYLFSLAADAGSTWGLFNEENMFDTGVAYLGIDGKVVSVTAYFGDGKQETFDRLIKIKEPTTTVTEFTLNVDGSITVKWRPPLIEKQLLRVELRLVGKGLFYTFPPDTYSHTIPAADLAAAGLLAGDNGILDVVYFTADKEYAFRHDFLYSLRAVPYISWPTASAITYGETLAASSLTGGSAYYNDSSVPGTFAFTNTALAPNAGTANQSVVFTPSDAVNYETVTGAVSVTVNKASQTITGFAMNPTTLNVGGTASLSAAGGGSGIQLVYTTTTPGICTVSGTTVTGVSVGVCTIEINQGGSSNYDPAAASVQNVTVGKGTPSVTAWPAAGNIYYGQTLASSVLAGGTASVGGTFLFDNPSTAPGSGTASQPVTFIPTDSVNYNTVPGTVSVTVVKATPTVTAWPTATGITYGQTLASSVLSGGSATPGGTFDFTSPSTAPASGTASQNVTFTPTDTTNYNTVSGTVSVTVAKATPIITTIPTASNITYEQTLAQSVLSGGVATVPGAFAFNSPSTAPAVGTASQAVTFFPSDMTNYNTVGTWANVTVLKGTPAITTMPVVSGMTYGMLWGEGTLTPGVAKNQAETVAVPGTFAFVDATSMPDAGTQTVDIIFTPVDTASWNMVTISMWATVGKATPGGGSWPTASNITYGQTLADSVLEFNTGDLYYNDSPVPGTFAFKYPSTVPNMGTAGYAAVFTPDDGNNYNSVEGVIDVTVVGQSQTITGFTFTTASILVGDTATASATGGASGNPVVFTSLTPGTCTVSGTNGQTITGLAIGICTIAANQAGNSTYDAATQVTRDVSISMFSAGKLVRIIGGEAHSIGVKDDGTVWTWGMNGSGRLGDGTFTDRHTPVPVPGLTGIIGVAGGNAHTLAVRYDGTVYAWGMNLYGQLGNGNNTDSWSPGAVSGLTGVIQVAAGDYHSVALKGDGTVWTWGYNTYGQLGDNTTASKNAPLMVPGISGAVRVGASGGHTLVAKSDGTVWAFGWNNHGQLGNNTMTNSPVPVQVVGLTGITELDGGYYHSIALRSDGAVFTWGWGVYGELGDGTGAQHLTPVQVPSLTGAVSVAAGDYHSLAVLNDGTVKTWGLNNDGQLGDGTANVAYSPVTVTGLTGMVQVGGGGKFSLALRNDGSVYTWGDNTWGQLGNNQVTDSSTAVNASGLNLGALQLISAGESHSVTLRNDGSVWSWGWNLHGQLGDATTTDRNAPVRSGTLTGIAAVDAGIYHTMALRNDGTVYAWGYNNYGQLGDGTTTPKSSPYLVPGVSGAIQVAGGYAHSVALKSDGTIIGWGSNVYGQLGDGTYVNRPAPALVLGLQGVVQVDAGENHTIALKSDGTVWTWGRNYWGQLGDGTNTDNPIPQKVPGLTGVIQIAAGGQYNLALMGNGTVWAWGLNNSDQIGTGSYTTSYYSPVQVTGLTGVKKVIAGSLHSMAIKNDGTVWAWGYNTEGAYGNGNLASSGTPVQVANLSGAVQISAGGSFSVVLKSDGTVWTTGKNDYGQLGNGTNTLKWVPVSVISIDASVKVPSYVYAWPTGSAITYGQALSSSSITGGSTSTPGTFAFDNPSYIPNAGYTSYAATFTPTDAAHYATVSGWVGVNVNKANPNVSVWPTSTPITYGQTLAASVLSGGTAAVPGAFSWQNPTQVPPVGTDYYNIRFIPTDSTNYLVVATGIPLTVNKADQAITNFNATASPIGVGQYTAVTAVGGLSGNPVTFSILTPSVCTIISTGYSSANIRGDAAGTCRVAADEAGNTNYNPAPQLLLDIGVVSTNTAPTAVDQYRSTPTGTPISITLTATDPDVGDSLTYSIVNTPPNGIVTGTPPNITYTPSAGYTGTIGIIFKAYDGEAYSNNATVTIKVMDPPPAPIISPADLTEFQVSTNVTVSYNIGAAPGGDGLVYSLDGRNFGGTLVPETDYTAPFNISGSQVVKARSYYNDGYGGRIYSAPTTATLYRVLAFADTGLTAAVRAAAGLAGTDPLEYWKVTSLTDLDASYRSITDLSGLDNLFRLTALSLEGNAGIMASGSNEAMVLALASLQSLDISITGTTDLAFVNGMYNLTTLKANDNGITDITPLAAKAGLTWLELAANSISDITPLTNLVNMKKLWLYTNPLSSLSPLNNMAQLELLELSDCGITDAQFAALGGTTLGGTFPALKVLGLGYNQLTDLSRLSTVTTLAELSIRDNVIPGIVAAPVYLSDIGPLLPLTNLTVLDMSNNRIPNDATTQSVLSGMTLLEYLDIRYNYMVNTNFNYLQFVKSNAGGTGQLFDLPQVPPS